MESIPSHGLIRAALHIWPLGLLRLFKNDLRMTGKMISVIGEDSHASLIRKATAEVSQCSYFLLMRNRIIVASTLIRR